MMRRLLLLLALCLPLGAAGDWYASPTGLAGNTGSISSPWDIATAFTSGSIKPGDTLWLRGGTYGTGGGYQVTSTLLGNSSSHITVKQYPGETAIINGGLYITSQYTWYWGFTVTNLSTVRDGTTTVRSAAFFAPNSPASPGNKFINLTIHDCGNTAFQFNDQGDQGEVYGSVIWGCGIFDDVIAAPAITHRGDGFYGQNETGSPKFLNNISFWNITEGAKAYSQTRHVNNFEFGYNTIFENGNRGLFLAVNTGSAYGVNGGNIHDNYVYHTNDSGVSGAGLNNRQGIQVGYTGWNQDVSLTNNVVVTGDGGTTGSSYIRWFDTVTSTGNTFVGTDGPSAGSIFELQDLSGATKTVNSNSYYRGSATPFRYQPDPGSMTSYNFANWKTATGFDASSTYSASNPTTNQVFVAPNAYEPGRANVTVFNWEGLASVSVDLSSVLSIGQRFEIRDVQDWYGTPIVAETAYAGGSVSITMPGAASAVSALVGDVTRVWPSGNPVHTTNRFGAFVVLPLMVKGVVVDSITYSGARISWDSDINTITLSGVMWDTQPTPPLAFSDQYRKTPGNGGNSVFHGKTLSGLPAGTTIYYQAYGTNPADSVVYYSKVGSFDTLPAPADRLADPPLPNEYRASPPSSYALDVTAPDCTTAFAGAATVNSIKWAAAQGVTGNVVVRLDYTDPSFQSPGCVASATTWAFPANTNTGWLQVRSSAPDLMLPPPGVRIRDEWRPGMVRLLNAWWQIEKQTAFKGDSANRLYLGPGLYFAESWPPPSSVFRTVTAIGTGVDPSVTVSDATGWADGQLVQIGDIAGMDKDHIYNCKIQGLSGNTFVAHGCTISGTYGGGAWVINSTGFSIPHITRHFTSNATDLVIDRCIFTVEHAPPTGQDSQVNLTGAENVHVRDSIFTGSPVWKGVDPDTGNTTSTFAGIHVAIDFSGCVGCTFENTYTNSPGITYFSQAGNGSRSAKDLVFRRNYLDWDTRWLTRDASAIGLYAHTRQPFETKSADTMLFEGNRIRHGWSSSDAGANSNAVWVIAAANDGGPDKDSVNVARNHTYRFNTISESHGGFGFRGKHYYQDDTLYGGHYLFHDNLISNLDGRRWKRNAGDIQSANPFTWADAMEGVIIRHNTIHNSRGSYPVVVLFNGGDPGSDFRFRDNLLTSVNRDSARGGINSTFFVGNSLQTAQHYTTPNGGVFDYGGNVVTAGVATSNLDSNYDLTSGGAYYSQTLCNTDWSSVGGACIGATGESANQRMARIKYFDGYRLRHDSQALRKASDGSDAGANIDKLEAAQGLIRNPRLTFVGSTWAKLGYTRPGDTACSIETSLSPTWGTGTRTVDPGLILNQEAYVPVEVTITGLTPATLYYYRILCPVEQPAGVFRTAP